MPTLDSLSEADIRAQIESHAPVLTVSELLRIGKEQGWTEDIARGKGSHRCLMREGYKPIVLKCHGLGTEQTRQATWKYLTSIYQPALDRIQQDQQKQAALREFMNALSQTLEDCQANFLSEAHLALQQVKARIELYETQRLQECENHIDGLINDEKDRQINEYKTQLQKTQQALAEANHQATKWRRGLEEQQQLEAIATAQLTTLQQSLQSATLSAEQQRSTLAQQQEELTQAKGQLAKYRTRQRQQALIMLVGTGILLALLVFAFTLNLKERDEG